MNKSRERPVCLLGGVRGVLSLCDSVYLALIVHPGLFMDSSDRVCQAA